MNRRGAIAVGVGLAALALCCQGRTCQCASGFHLPGARASGMGGITVVGESCSPLRVAAWPGRGLEVRSSWANPYGIEGLQVCAVTLRNCWERAGAALALQALSTPTPFSEIHLLGVGSVTAAEGVVMGAGLDLASLGDSGGSFARELSASLGLSLGSPRGPEAGCAVLTSLSSEDPTENGWPDGGGYFRWGVGAPFGERACFLLEDERRRDGGVRRFGGEIELGSGVELRAGLTYPPFTVSLGLGVRAGGTALDLSLAQHEALGTTPYVTVSYRSGRAVEPGGAERQKQ